MPYGIDSGCNACNSCWPECPTGAIKAEPLGDGYWIDPTLCDNCQELEKPRCLDVCNVGSLAPITPKKGRSKSTLLPAAILDIFRNGKNTPFASSMVIWESCNILAQRQSLPWHADAEGQLCYRRTVRRGLGEMRFRLMADPESSPTPIPINDGLETLENFDIRATCIHLIFAAYAMTLDRPWDETFVLNNQHIEKYLKLDKRKDLNKLNKLILIKDLVHQACQLLVALEWPRQGKFRSFSLDEHPIWQLVDTQYFFEEDSIGHRHLIGLSFTIKPGIWAKHFLNKQGYRHQTAFYQYGSLPQSLLLEIMSNWQQHEGGIRILLWLLFKLRLGGEQRVKISTLLSIAYGDDRLVEATTVRGAHKRLLKTFEGDLETIYYYGLKPLFDEETYPTEIQPLWARVAEIPDGADEALDFWVEDAHRSLSLTDAAPRDKWQRLLNARIVGFELSDDWKESLGKRPAKRRRKLSSSRSVASPDELSGRDISAARSRQKLSQRALAKRLGKSQSWIRDIEKGRFKISESDCTTLRQVLNL
ncbi:MAG: helix-turn-helix domain-containing protein [Synechococcus sp.]